MTEANDTSHEKIAGEPLNQAVFRSGPFVMTTREEIEKTLLDCETCSICLSISVVLTLAHRPNGAKRIRKSPLVEERDWEEVNYTLVFPSTLYPYNLVRFLSNICVAHMNVYLIS
jgi:hypothetical protein